MFLSSWEVDFVIEPNPTNIWGCLSTELAARAQGDLQTFSCPLLLLSQFRFWLLWVLTPVDRSTEIIRNPGPDRTDSMVVKRLVDEVWFWLHCFRSGQCLWFHQKHRGAFQKRPRNCSSLYGEKGADLFLTDDMTSHVRQHRADRASQRSDAEM